MESAAPQVSPEDDVPVHGGEKMKTNSVHVQTVTKTVPVTKCKLSVVLSDRGQGREDVTTRTGRLSRKPDKLNL